MHMKLERTLLLPGVAATALVGILAICAVVPASGSEILGLESTAAVAEGDDYILPFRDVVMFEGFMLTIGAAEAYRLRVGEYPGSDLAIMGYLPGNSLVNNAWTVFPVASEPIAGHAAIPGQVGLTHVSDSSARNIGLTVTLFGKSDLVAVFGSRITE